MSPILTAILSAPPNTLLIIVAGGLGYIIYLLVKNQRGQDVIAQNHLHELPEMAETLRRIETSLKDISTKQDETNQSLQYLKGRINGHS
jgi:hypothetical protein